MSYKEIALVQNLLNSADIKINGSRPWDIKVNNEEFYHRVLTEGSLGLGESYMDSWWDAESLEEFFFHIFVSDLDKKVAKNWKDFVLPAINNIINPQSKDKAFIIGEKHYDLGNDLYQAMLDKRMTYSCAYWENASNLDEAQEAKLDLICRKLGLHAGQNILDIGGGWGSFAKFAAEKYGVNVTVITVSKEQINLGQRLCEGLPVNFLLQDYRDIQGKFDHIVSIGMIEHVGVQNYEDYMEIVKEHLSDTGLFLLHTIGGNKSVIGNDPWINKYIFPNSMLPSAKQLTRSFEGIFVMEDWHNFGYNYYKTIMAWFNNFHNNYPSLMEKYDERFYRMWKYYLLSCAGSFKARKNQLWQIVLSKKGVKEGYKSIR